MKKYLSNFIICIFFLIGISLLLYPTISNYYNSLLHTKVIANYTDQVDALDETSYNEIIAKAKEYNKNLLEARLNNIIFNEKDGYQDILNILDGNMGYIEIPKINVKLPIYHDTSEEVLQIGIGHMVGSSFPTGEEGTHAVLLGHRGLPGSKLFTNLDKIKEKDLFYINILTEKIIYEVDKIDVVTPDNLDYLEIEEGKSYITLVTCTPYGINSHRLLVRGHKIEENQLNEIAEKTTNNQESKNSAYVIVFLVFLAFLIIVILILTITDIFKITFFNK